MRGARKRSEAAVLKGGDRAPSLAAVIASATAVGVMILLSFPPFGQGWLMWFALTPLFAIHQRLGRRLLFAYGYLLAALPVVAIACGVLPSSRLLFVLFVVGVPAAFAVGIVAATALESRVTNPWGSLLVFPGAAVVVEAILGTEAVRVPATIALTQADYPLLIQGADVFGTAGVTWLLLLVNRAWPAIGRAVLAESLRSKEARAAIGLGMSAFLVNVAYGVVALARDQGDDDVHRVATLQPAIATSEYLQQVVDRGVRTRLDRTVNQLVDDALGAQPTLLIVSEGGNGRYNMRIPTLRRRLERVARRSGAGLLVSSPDMNPEGEKFNALFSLGADGELVGAHRKRLLTPVGERHLRPGAEHQAMSSAIGRVGAMVCFESCFANVARRLVRDGAEYLLVSTSDASFKNSALALLHSRFSIFRAVETRRYLVQAANTGPSLIVDPTGRIRVATPFLRRTVLKGRVGLREGETFFVRFGAVLPLLCSCGLALVAVRARVRRLDASAPLRWRRASVAWAGVWYVAVAALGTGASIHLATAGTIHDGGPLANVASFFETPAAPSVRAATRDYLQRAPKTCGPAALAFLLGTYGLDVDQERIARWVNLDERGTSMLDLARAAERLGLRAWGERMNLEALRQAPTPPIVYLPLPGHFVVVLNVERGWVYYFDPTTGPTRAREAEFQRRWNGYALHVRFAAIPEIDRIAPKQRVADGDEGRTTSPLPSSRTTT